MLSRSLFLTGSPPPPTITSFSPTSLNNGTGNVTITGTNFITGATSVTVNGTNSTTTVNSLTSLTVAFPSLGRGTYSVVVTTPGGSASANYTYTVTPSISYITPSSVYYDYGGGYTIVGSRFSSSGATSVYVSNGGYYGISIANDGQLSFNPGALGAGNYAAYVVAPDGWSNAVGFSTSWYPAPSISSVSDGRSGNGSLTGSTITVGGSGFTGASVSIGGVGVSASVSDTSISFACPNLGGDGSRTITVTTARSGNQSASTSVYFWGARGASAATYTSGSGSYTPPQWANYLDVVVMGGGGGGGAGGVLAWGGGGGGGGYNYTTANLLSSGFGARSYSVGGGGLNGGAKGVNQPGNPGDGSSAAGISAGGGAAGCGFCNGAAGATTAAINYGGVSYPAATGGGFGNSADAGGNPGSGGGGGNSGGGPFPGKPGRAGAVYFRAYQ